MSQTNNQPYNYDIIRMFTIMSVVWGVLGMLAGVYIALELTWPVFNLDIPEITFGRFWYIQIENWPCDFRLRG